MNQLATIKVAAALRAAARVWRAGLRPARWLFAAAVGVVAALSVPLVAAGTPFAAHASHLTGSQSFASQPTVTEGATDAQGERLLAGADRYATAVLLAGVPLDAGDAATREVLVVSGESLVDAVSAVSVAASRDAAIVLTATDAVPEVVAEFIAGRGFDRVTVGGGTAAVSDTTAGELAALIGDPNDDRSSDGSGGATGDSSGGGSSGATGGGSAGTSGGRSSGGAGDASGVVRRVAGATRVETAVVAARAAGQPGEWCDTGYRGAVAVSGESLVDGVIAAPVAYAWRLPLLFTEADRLPEVVAEFLKGTANVRHVTVVGAPADVGQTVVRDVARSNDIDVLRIDADSPAERSVELAEAVAHCRSQPVAPGQYALLDANQPVDGVAAAAALANGLGEHGTSETLIPVLAVNQNSLPQPVADYLAQAGRRHDIITLYPLGGVARLTPRVIDRAVSAARGNPDTTAADDAVGGAAGVDVSDAALIAAGLTPGKSDGTGVAVGVGVVIENGVIRIDPPANRRVSTSRLQIGSPDDDAMPIPDEWFASPGVLDPYLWQPEIEVLEANVDHDGDGALSADERWPLGSPERAAYMVASGGQAPPGATVLVAPDVRARNGDEGGRNTAVRYPVGIPVPPGAPDRTTTTFEERQVERKARFEAYSGGRGFGSWDIHFFSLCEKTPEGAPGSSSIGVTKTADGITCETAADWYLWMCDTMNSPEIKALGFVEAWLTTIDRFQDQWISQTPAAFLFQEGIEDSVVVDAWALEQGTTPLCTFNADPANYNSEANLAAKAAALRELNEWGSDPANGFTAGSGTPDADSAFWDWPGDRMFALRFVAENLRNRQQNQACNGDVRECSVGDFGSTWGLRTLA